MNSLSAVTSIWNHRVRLFQRITRGRREVTWWKLDVRRQWWLQLSPHSRVDRWLFHRISWWGVNTQLRGCFYSISKRIRQELTLSRKRQQGKQQVPPSRGDTTAEAEKVMMVPCPFLLPCGKWKTALSAGSVSTGPGREFFSSQFFV